MTLRAIIDITSGAAETLSALTNLETQVNWRVALGAGPKTLNIPGAAAINNGFLVGATDCLNIAGDEPITFVPASGTIMGAPTAVISQPGGTLTLQSDGANGDWTLYSRYP